MRYPFNASDRSISILFNGRMHNIPQSHPVFQQLRAELKKNEHDTMAIRKLIDTPSVIAELTEGDVTVIGSTVYHKGEALHDSLTKKMIALLAEGFDIGPWARFLDRLMKNPSQNSRNCLYDFLTSFDAPITEDGCFIAFKRVNSDYTDKYTGTFDNSPGKIVQMPREQVVDDPEMPCSAGLHACSVAYLDHAYCRSRNMRTIAVKIDPVDVVSVPRDYNYSKLRCCEYRVIGDIDEAGTTPTELIKQPLFDEESFKGEVPFRKSGEFDPFDLFSLDLSTSRAMFQRRWATFPNERIDLGVFVSIAPSEADFAHESDILYRVGIVVSVNEARVGGGVLNSQVLVRWQDGVLTVYDNPRHLVAIAPRDERMFDASAIDDDDLDELGEDLDHCDQCGYEDCECCEECGAWRCDCHLCSFCGDEFCCCDEDEYECPSCGDDWCSCPDSDGDEEDEMGRLVPVHIVTEQREPMPAAERIPGVRIKKVRLEGTWVDAEEFRAIARSLKNLDLIRQHYKLVATDDIRNAMGALF